MEGDRLLLQAIPHVFLPKRTPEAAQYELGNIEQFLLHFVHQSVSRAISDAGFSDDLHGVLKMLKTWEILQPNPNSLYPEEEKDFVANFVQLVSTPEPQTLPLYVRKQNCTILIEQQEDGLMQVETFRVALPSQLVMSSVGPLFMDFPETRDVIQNRDLLASSIFAESLYQLAKEAIGISTPVIHKGGRALSDVRDVPEPYLISDWMVTLLSPTAKVKESQQQKEASLISKKIRDQVTLIPVERSSSLFPFRRSGLWLSMKVALQLKLRKLFHNDAQTSKFVYKLLMLTVFADICKNYYDLKEELKIDLDLAAQMLAKLGNRVLKLQKLPHSENKQDVFSKLSLKLEVLRAQVLEHVEGVARNMQKLMKAYQTMDINDDDDNDDQLPLRSQENYLNDLNHSIPFLSSFKEIPNRVSNDKPTSMMVTDDNRRSLTLRRYASFNEILTGSKSLNQRCNLKERIWLNDTETFMKNHLSKTDSCIIQQLVRTYVKHGLNLYKNNPIGISQMILVVLKAVEVLDRKAAQAYPLLLRYRSGITCQTFDCLLLPHKDDMNLLGEILSYFERRDKNANESSGILLGKVNRNSFAAMFASQDQKMMGLRDDILRTTEQIIANRLAGINNSRIECGHILQQIRSEPKHCSCQFTVVKKKKQTTMKKECIVKCNKCKLEDKLQSTRTKFPLFELPLPREEYLQNAVVFELLIPQLISDLRDCLAILKVGLLEEPVFNQKKNTILIEWNEYKNLKAYLPPSCSPEAGRVIRLGSRCLNISATCYRKSKPDILAVSDDQLVVENGLQCIYTYLFTEELKAFQKLEPKKRLEAEKKSLISPLVSLKKECSFQIDGLANSKSYLPLQKYLQYYNHSQNHVIANQASCHEDLSLDEFLSFGSIRAGHRIQLRNLYRAIASKVLSLEEEAVLALVLQTIWEVGPSDEDMNNREAHLDFEDEDFCIEILIELQNLIHANETNYSHPLKLMAAVVITVRILELNDKVAKRCLALLKQWRLLMRRWTQEIELERMAVTDPAILKELQKTLLLIRICSALSYNFSKSIKWDRVMTCHKDILEWYHTISGFSENEKDDLLSMSSNRLSKFMHILLNIGRNVALQLELETELMNQPILVESLRMFVTDKWAKAAEFNKAELKFISKAHKNLIQLTYLEETRMDCITFDFILGTFLVNGFPEGQLPVGVTSLPYFRRFFQHNFGFRVQRESSTVFRTSAKFHGKHYEFEIFPNVDSNDNAMNVVIKEIWDNGAVLTLLQNKNFLGDFVPTLVEDYTHWFDPKRSILFFRRIPIQATVTDYKLPPEYKLVKQAEPNKWHLLDERNHLAMLSIKSEGFKNIADALKRLELSHHITAVINVETNVLSAHLPRYNLRFFVNHEGSLESVEYPGLRLIGKGKLQTLIGLQNGIQLKSKSKQVLMVPNGSIHVEGVDQDDTQSHYHHQTVIALEELRQPSYFIYEFDKVLSRLVANKSKQAWLYLAALNAVTSSVLPDPFTGVTGTEMALRILQSGCIWSCSPYDEDSLRILEFIKNLAPRRIYYGHKFLQGNGNPDEDNEEGENKIEGSIEAVEWPVGLPSMAAYDGYEIIVEKLIEDSERLGPLYYVDKKKMKKNATDDEEHHAAELTELSTTLRLRSYFSHLSSYNQGAAVKPNYFRSSILKDKLKVENQQVQVKSTREKLVRLDSVASTALIRLSQFHRSGSPLFQKKNENTNLYNFLITEYMPYHDGSPNSLKDIFNLDFRTNWGNIYEMAVQKNRSTLEEHHFTLLLCAMAYKKAPIDQILNLHYISTFANQIDFPQPIQFPDYGCQFPVADPSELDVELIFRDILFRNVNLQRAYLELGISWERYEVIFGGHVDSMATFLSKKSATWPLDCNIGDVIRVNLTQLYIMPEEAISQIDGFLSRLHWTFQLKEFATSVQKKLDGIYNLLSSKPKPTTAAKTSKSGIGMVRLGGVVWKLELPVSEFIDETQLNQKLEKKAEKWFGSGQVGAEFRNGDQFELISERMAHSIKVKEILQNIMEMQNGCTDGKILCWTGLQPRNDPTSLLKCLFQRNEDGRANIMRNYAGALAVLWVHIKRLNRCLAYQEGGQIQEFQREMENVGHENWDQQARPEWLLLELELGIMIRPIQIEVAEQMMKMPDGGNGVMQMNMGEGKTSVIVPMLCCILGKRDALCRVTVLSSMFNMNYGILSFAIGGLLNRRVYTIPCRRDMEIGEECADGIQNVYRECLGVRGVLLTLPEYRLSFRLLAYDNILKGEVPLGMKLLKTENWLRLHARDILDESDELLNAKYQLVYTVGEQISLDGGELRWTTCQKLLKIVQEVGKDFLEKYGEECVEFSKEEGNQNPHQFTPFRLLDHSIFLQFVSTVADRFIDGIIVSADEKLRIKQLLTQEKIKKSRLEESLKMVKDLPDLLNTILIMSGYLRRGVLTLGLSKRWRVEYGVDASKFFRRMAVPFRAKDVPAERTKFGHPDLAILLTHLSYYYSGLSDLQLEETIKLLGTKQGSEAIYGSWIQQIPDMQVPKNLSNLHGLSLKDARQRTRLFGLLRRHKAVVDFWLSHKVFPRESKQFPAKLVMTSWDLCYERQVHPVTGFSGTNDSSVLLPLAIAQQDLPSLVSTNKEVEGMLLQRENQGHRNLEMGVKCIDILKMMKKDNLTVLIDAGALMLEYNNEEVANKWLQLDKELEAVLYFSSTNELVVMCRTGPGQINGCIVPFELSSFQDRLDKCGIFLDDQHTRGTDLKFPVGTRGCVTVGGKMKRDKLIQACMRMRKLGRGHSVTFYLSHEAYEKVMKGRKKQAGGKTNTIEILEWTRANTQRYNEDGLLYWAIAGKNYAQRLAAEDNFYFPSSFKNFQMDSEEHKEAELWLDGKANIMGQQCMDVEVTTLMELYGNHIQPDLIVRNISKWMAAAMHKLKARNNCGRLPANVRADFETISKGLIGRCQVHIPNKTHLSGSNMEEEQEKELELEKEMEVEEELIIERRGKANPAKNILHKNVLQVILQGESLQIKEGLMRLCDIFKDTTFWGEVQPEGWGNEVFATTDFIRVVKEKYVKTDLFSRPIEYVVSLERKSGTRQMLVLSPFEVNELMPRFRNGNVAKATCLHMFSLRRSEKQNLLLNLPRLMLPRGSELVQVAEDCSSVAALLLASGNLYFHSMEEQKGFTRFLRLAPHPWTKEEEKAFEKGLITKTGYMMAGFRDGGEMEGGFERDPSGLVRKILMCRHPVLSDMAHVVQLLNERCLANVGKGLRK